MGASKLKRAYQDILVAIKDHHMGCNTNSLWQLLKALSAWSTNPIEHFLINYPHLLLPIANDEKSAEVSIVRLAKKPVALRQAFAPNKEPHSKPFKATFDYAFNKAGRIDDKSIFLSIHGFGLKRGHADALAKKIPDFLPWKQWQSNIRRQLSQLIELPFHDDFFDWLQTVLQRLGVEFMAINPLSCEYYVSPFLNSKTVLNTLNEEMVYTILQEQIQQADISITLEQLSTLSRYLIRFLQRFQFNRAQSLGIGANWGGVVSDANEDGVDTFRFNDPEWATQFRNLSLHRQGPAEAYMNAALGIKYELAALVSNFKYATQLQPSEYPDILYNALIDNLITGLFPEPSYFGNEAYIKYCRHFVVTYADDRMQKITSFYLPDPQGIYYKTNKGEYKQTPMFRQAGSLLVEAFPRDTGSSESAQSYCDANPLWPLQLQYAQCASIGTRGHIVYNPIGPDEFIQDTFYGQVIRETGEVFVPFIGVIPKNFDKNFKFKQAQLCASYVIQMEHSSRIMTHCPAFRAYYLAIATRFLPSIDRSTPSLPSCANLTIKHKWQELDKALRLRERTAEVCQNAFFSLFKELIYSLYPLTKEDIDLHYYFVELTCSPDAFEPRSRATCERMIRELTTLKPSQNIKGRQDYENILQYLKKLTGFFYPTPSDETAKAIAEQSRLHVKTLLALPEIKNYFADLTQKHSPGNSSPKISPGLMHDVLKYQGPSPTVYKDFYRRRHDINFYSGYRDLDGNQIVHPSTRESALDVVIKTVGALLPLIRRNKTIFSLVTQPFAKAYIAGHQTYYKAEHYKILLAMCSGLVGFFYGVGLGTVHSLTVIPRTIYHSFFASIIEQQKANHALAISSAPGNRPGSHVKAIMHIRDNLLQLIATANGHGPSNEHLISLLLTQVKNVLPSLLSDQAKEVQYKEILLKTFPLKLSEWQQLFEPVIDASNNAGLQHIINKHALYIDSVLIYALFECLTAQNCEQAKKEVIKAVTDKHKLKDPQDKVLAILVNYYANNPEAKRNDIAKYRFDGKVLMKLREKEQKFRKIQIWMLNALDLQWGLEALLTSFVEQEKFRLDQHTLANIIVDLPNYMKEILQELFTKPGNKWQIFKKYQLDTSQMAFLSQYSNCYKTITSKDKKDFILEKTCIRKMDDSSFSIKAREHLKLTQFIEREWHHQLLPLNSVHSIINAIKQQIKSLQHPAIDELVQLYRQVLKNPKDTKAFDAFYYAALKIQADYDLDTLIHEWVNVSMNAFVNLLLENISWDDNNVPNPLKNSDAVMDWLKHLNKNGVRALLSQQIEQTRSFDEAAWRCQHLLHALETFQPNQGYIRGTGMQKLLRIICQNKNTITATREQRAKDVSIKALCRYSITMQHALSRVKEKIPNAELVRPIEVTLRP